MILCNAPKNLVTILPILIIALLPLISCHNSSNENNIKISNTKYFNQEEIKSINNFLFHFDNQICEVENIGEGINCYSVFFERLKKEAESSDFDIRINRTSQDELIEIIGEHIFKNSFEYDTTIFNRRIRERYPDEVFPDTIETLNFNRNGKIFMYFSQEVSKYNIKVKKYTLDIDRIGDIGPALIGDVLVNYKDYNIEDPRFRLLIAVHYLILNENFLRYEQSYIALNKELNLKENN